ncbi:MAG TPA: SEC-C metal-binding domain-containing protein, partial [Bacillota bacterium]|nr:SEC-C metal-binding domain-containing protein [Bacillota bacterium]
EQYMCDVTYGTNNEFGFDYLRDNMVTSMENRVQRKPHYAIVDEVDSILIDEARTPLIISGQAEDSGPTYATFAKVAQLLEPDVDYTVDEKARTVAINEPGIDKIERRINVDNLYDEANIELMHHAQAALKARALFKRDRDYIVTPDGQVVIVDEFTGRLMHGRRYSDGIHQAIEAKEGVKVQEEHRTMATITFQNYFRMYEKLAGMTGTAKTEEDEFRSIYGLDVIEIPTAKPMIRLDNPDAVFKGQKAKYENILADIEDCYKRGQPVLVGTVSIDKNEALSEMLRRRGIKHQVLNAKYHEKEAEIIKLAGQKGAVTIATNMAGRGTDIVLGEGVAALGGLHVIGTERHESRRIDNQLRGRSGRQGDPGSSRFFVAMDDDLMRLFGGENIGKILGIIGWNEGEAIEHPQLSRQIEAAQKRVESRHFDMRKHLLQYDDVMNKQREAIYSQRDVILRGEDIKERSVELCKKTAEGLARAFADEKGHPEEWDVEGLSEQLTQLVGRRITADGLKAVDWKGLIGGIDAAIADSYEQRELTVGAERMRALERAIMLYLIDNKWVDHLSNIELLKEGIGLRAYGQKDPLIEYRKESFNMFNDMLQSIGEDFIKLVMRVRFREEGEEAKPPVKSVFRNVATNRSQEGPKEPAKAKDKIGRNDPCPCGSGKKYKKCCGMGK